MIAAGRCSNGAFRCGAERKRDERKLRKAGRPKDKVVNREWDALLRSRGNAFEKTLIGTSHCEEARDSATYRNELIRIGTRYRAKALLFRLRQATSSVVKRRSSS